MSTHLDTHISLWVTKYSHRNPLGIWTWDDAVMHYDNRTHRERYEEARKLWVRWILWMRLRMLDGAAKMLARTGWEVLAVEKVIFWLILISSIKLWSYRVINIWTYEADRMLAVIQNKITDLFDHWRPNHTFLNQSKNPENIWYVERIKTLRTFEDDVRW